MVKYYKIEWVHDANEEYPYCYYIEVGDDFYETKKIEKYKDGRVYFADDKIEQGTFLSPEPIENVDVYNSSDDNEILKGFEISKIDFFNEWKKLIR